MSMSSDSTAAPGMPGRQVFLMALSCALAVSAIYYHQPLLPQMAASLGVTPGEIGLVAMVTQFGYAIGLLCFVPLADGIQPRKLASWLIGGNAVAMLGCAMAPALPVLVAASLLVGMTAVTAQIIIPSVSGMATPETRGRIVGAMLGGLSSGVLLARLLSGVVGAHLGWRAIFVLAVLVDLALLAVVRQLPVAAGLTRPRYRALMGSLVTLFREEPLLRLSAATGFLVFAAFSAFWASLAALLVQPPYEFGPTTIGAMGLAGLPGLLMSTRIGAFVDRFGGRNMVTVGAFLANVAFICLAMGGSGLVPLILGMVLLDFGNRATLVANQSRIYALRPDARSRLNTVFMVAYFLGGAAGAALGGYGVHHAGWTGLAIVGAVFSLAAVVVNTLGYRSQPVMRTGQQA